LVWDLGGDEHGVARTFHFDAYPFSFLTLVVSLEAIFLSAFILISRNRQNILSKRRAQLDLQINMLSEQENTAMLCLLQKIAPKVGVAGIRADKLEVLAQAIQPEQLARQIEETCAKARKRRNFRRPQNCCSILMPRRLAADPTPQ